MIDTYIPVDAGKIPYEFNIKISGRTYAVDLDYNEYSKTFTIGLSTLKETLCRGIPVLYGNPLFEQIRDSRYPAVYIIPYCDTSDPIEEITPDNFGTLVKLWIIPRETGDDNPYYSGYGY